MYDPTDKNNISSGSIPTLKLNSNIAENDKQKAELLNHYFTSQTMVDDANKELPHIDPSNHTLDSIVISCQDVKDVLLHLNVTKASGPREGGGGNLEVILVPMSGPKFQN